MQEYKDSKQTIRSEPQLQPGCEQLIMEAIAVSKGSEATRTSLEQQENISVYILHGKKPRMDMVPVAIHRVFLSCLCLLSLFCRYIYMHAYLISV